jgi:hypothetical protein
MESPYLQIVSLLDPYVVEASGVNIFLYPGTKDELADNLQNSGVETCIPRFSLLFKDMTIDLDLLFYIIDVIKTTDGGVVFFSPESRILELKMVRRPGGNIHEIFTSDHPGFWRPSG